MVNHKAAAWALEVLVTSDCIVQFLKKVDVKYKKIFLYRKKPDNTFFDSTPISC